MPFRKKLSGAAYKKERQKRALETDKQSGSINKLVKRLNVNEKHSGQEQEANEDQPCTSTISQDVPNLNISEQIMLLDSGPQTSEQCEHPHQALELPDVHAEPVIETTSPTYDISDPYNWPPTPTLPDSEKVAIVKLGPLRPSDSFCFPTDRHGRRFTIANTKRLLRNGEEIIRSWLVYSKLGNVVYCFCCKLFGSRDMLLATTGYSDWRNLSQCLREHETSSGHLCCHQQWIELSTRIKSEQTIDKRHQQVINAEVQHWHDVLLRIVAIVQYLGRQCLAFRGSSDKLFHSDNGNFLKLVELLSKFDPPIAEHVRRMSENEIKRHYLGKNIQNEIIQLISKAINGKILQMLTDARYYSIIVDCTPDSSHTEQMSIVVRFVECYRSSNEPDEVKIHEHFLQFVSVERTTSEMLTNTILSVLSNNNIPLQNMRGQGYDNGSNMRGKHSGVQKRLLELNSRAFFVPCTSHTLNLVVNDAAMSSRDAVEFFDTLQKVFVFLSGSTRRWTILKKHVTQLTVKPLCDTRWESRIDTVKPFRYQIGEIYDSLYEIANDNYEPLVRHEAECLAKKIKTFKFLCSVVIWHDILFKVNIASKILQDQTVSLAFANETLHKTMTFLRSYRSDVGFYGAITDAKELASNLEVVPEFSEDSSLRPRVKKSLFTYEKKDTPIVNPETKFKVEFFFKILDAAICSLEERYEQLHNHTQYFGFLYDIQKLKKMTKDDLLKHCLDLQTILTDSSTNDSDIDALEMRDELLALSFLTKECMPPEKILQYITSNNFAPNVAVALRILLTLPISVASGERTFSKLKLIKNYLRSSMSQERLTGLATLSIEHEILDLLDPSELVHSFACLKARKECFK